MRGALLAALETSAPLGSVALARDGEVVARVFLEGRSTHGARLVPALEALLEGVAADRRDLAGVVVGSGPGSFTGVRVAAATAKGLVHALGIPLWAVSSLEAAAVADRLPDLADGGPWEVPPDLVDAGIPGDGPEREGGPTTEDGPEPEARYVLFDARGDRVYAACYRPGAGGLDVIRPPRATRLGAVLAESRPPGVRFAGRGALRHREAIAAAGAPVLPPPAGMPTADGLLHVLALRPDAAPVEDPWGWEPEYLRESGAERARKG